MLSFCMICMKAVTTAAYTCVLQAGMGSTKQSNLEHSMLLPVCHPPHLLVLLTSR
jgi:hypothetical protein